ncbi:hypothetical protein EK21DRAFT_93643 [Setomelanomma holmii]|uniref:Uncharacterized protein n=1 Tax=Setomelanomma holmii TaxID=210430 RepID=A0A9P4H1E7_9PLEO|nr:hypothetical protein EK21DRAFT_93643 [Setomelanomma holmii]
MVLYHANGRVVKAHEDYLEQAARRDADDPSKCYIDQIDVVKQRNSNSGPLKNKSLVHIVVDAQDFSELYVCESTDLIGERIFVGKGSRLIPPKPKGLNKDILMKCSSYAEEFFTYHPDETELHLPICYPRKHASGAFDNPISGWNDFVAYYGDSNNDRITAEGRDRGKNYRYQRDKHMAYIREHEIGTYIVDWLERIEEHWKNHITSSEDQDEDVQEKDNNGKGEAPLPRIRIPERLDAKIHLYNVILQLGITSFFRQEFIDTLVLQMYKTDMDQCYLDLLELTVCRFTLAAWQS